MFKIVQKYFCFVSFKLFCTFFYCVFYCKLLTSECFLKKSLNTQMYKIVQGLFMYRNYSQKILKSRNLS